MGAVALASSGSLTGNAVRVRNDSSKGQGQAPRPGSYEYYEYGSYYSDAGSARGSKSKALPHAGATEYEYVYYDDDKYEGAGAQPAASRPSTQPMGRPGNNMGEDPMLLSTRMAL